MTVGGPALVFAATAIGLLLGASPIGWTAAERTPAPPVPDRGAGGRRRARSWRSLRRSRRDPRRRPAGDRWPSSGCSMFLVGSLDICYAVLAIDVLGLGQGGVGAMGRPADSAASLERRRPSPSSVVAGSARPLLLAAVASGLAIAVVGSIPFVLPAIVLPRRRRDRRPDRLREHATLIQRLAPAGVRSRVFASSRASRWPPRPWAPRGPGAGRVARPGRRVRRRRRRAAGRRDHRCLGPDLSRSRVRHPDARDRPAGADPDVRAARATGARVPGDQPRARGGPGGRHRSSTGPSGRSLLRHRVRVRCHRCRRQARPRPRRGRRVRRDRAASGCATDGDGPGPRRGRVAGPAPRAVLAALIGHAGSRAAADRVVREHLGPAG